MPSSYTSPLYDGEEISFADFMLRMARGMGATILLRDEPLSVLPTVSNVGERNDYLVEKMQDAQIELGRLAALSPEDVAREHKREQKERDTTEHNYRKKNAELRERYEGMLEQVRAWEPPTVDHEGLKQMAIDQLQQSIDFDCHDITPVKPGEISDEQWQEDRLAATLKEIRYCREEISKKQERNRGRIEWISALRKSLGVSAFDA